MKFEDMETNDFRNLNLLRIVGKHFIRQAIIYKKAYVYHRYNGTHLHVADKEITFKDDIYVLYCTMEINSFLDMTEDDFRNVFLFGEKTIAKYLWLQKYLKGEVDGQYHSEKDEKLIEFAGQKEIEKRNKQIDTLLKKIEKLSEELEEEKNENRNLRKRVIELEKARKAIREIQKIEI